MVSTSKILTVSYGTFSCTLEGFDDSFDTMKAIAEYFRDLAADDRYFGAEPPTPDAEMLARIAEREIARRVEAHEDGGRIVLRAGTPALGRDSARDDAAQDDAAQAPATPRTAEPKAAPQQAAAPVWPEPEADAEVMPTVATDPESVAAKLRRIRAVASPAFASYDEADYTDSDFAGTDFAGSDAAYGETAYAEDEHAQDFLGSTIADLDAALAQDDAEETPEARADAEEMAFETEAEAEDAPRLDADAQPEPDTEAAPDEDGALIEPVEAIVAGETGIEETVTAEADAEDAVSDAHDAVAPEHLAESDDAVAAEPAEEPSEADDEVLAAFAEAHETDEAPVAAEEPADLDEVTLEDDILFPGETDEVDIFDFSDETDDEDDDADDYDDEMEDDSSADTLAQLMADALRDDERAAAEPAAETEAQDSAAPLGARVVKMKRRDFEAAVAEGALESGDSTLSAEEEAELQRELAEVEAELAGTLPRLDVAEEDVAEEDVAGEDIADEDSADDDSADAAFDDGDAPADDLDIDLDETEDEAAQDDAPARRSGHMEAGVPDSQAMRIFEQTDSHLEEPETHQRRNAIQHLRAAVAATRAEKTAGGSMRADVDDQPYRLDLESAVRPRRPQPVSETRSERPAAAPRPAPLKLVAEQRIDAPTGPVQPRRVSRADLMAAETSAAPVPEGAESFGEFAEKMGANTLPELLEAAAAYMADVEGHRQFSRPMLMQKLREIDETGFSREEGLRSFGQLLRQGKLQKLKGGRFAVTDVTEFRQAG